MVRFELLTKSIPKYVWDITSANAHSYDFVSGIGKNGKFQILSFKDEARKLIQRDFFDFSQGKRKIRERTYFRRESCTDILDIFRNADRKLKNRYRENWKKFCR